MSDDVIQRYEQELADDPQSRVFAPLAEAYRKAGRLEDAINVARTGLDVHPGYSAGLVVLGRALYEKGELDNAAEILQSAVSDNPENYLGQKFLGKVLMDKGENPGAMKAFEAANFISPEDEEVTRLLEEVKGKIAAPKAMKYEAEEMGSDEDAQIVTYEQKPTTVDGIELPPLPPDADEDTFSFSGGGTADPVDLAPVPVIGEETVTADTDIAEIAIEEIDAEDMTATVIDEEEVEQTMAIESLDELGPEAAAFIQEGEDIVVESVDDPLHAVPGTAQNEDFIVEIEDIPSPPADFDLEPAAGKPPDIQEMPVSSPAPDPVPEPVSAPVSEPGTAPPPAQTVQPPRPETEPEPATAPVSDPAAAPPPVEFVQPAPQLETGPETVSAPVFEPVGGPPPAQTVQPPPQSELEPDLLSEPIMEPVQGLDEDRIEPGVPATGPASTPEPFPATPPPSDEPFSQDAGREDQFSTETLADLYAQQGLTEKAVSMYRQILESTPDNEAVKLKLGALENKQPVDEAIRQEVLTEAEVERPRQDNAEDALNVLEGMLDNLERIKRP